MLGSQEEGLHWEVGCYSEGCYSEVLLYIKMFRVEYRVPSNFAHGGSARADFDD